MQSCFLVPSLGQGPWEHTAGSRDLGPRVATFTALFNFVLKAVPSGAMVALRDPVGHIPTMYAPRDPPLTKRQAPELSRLRVQPLAKDFTSLSLRFLTARAVGTSDLTREVTSHPGCQDGLTLVIRHTKILISLPLTTHLLSAKCQIGHLTPPALSPTVSPKGWAETQTPGCGTLHPRYRVCASPCGWPCSRHLICVASVSLRHPL